MFATTTRHIECVQCGLHYETIRKNTKRCSICQLIAGMSYTAARGNKGLRICPLSDDEFLPIDGSDKLCAACTPSSRRAGRGECVFCHEDKPFCRVDVSACLACAQDPKNRKALYKALLKKQARQMETDYGPLPPQEPWPEKKETPAHDDCPIV